MGKLLDILKLGEPERQNQINALNSNELYPVYSAAEFKCKFGRENATENFPFGKRRIVTIKKGLHAYPLEVALFVLNKFGEGSLYGETNNIKGFERPLLLDYDPGVDEDWKKLDKKELEKFAVEKGIEGVFADQMNKKDMVAKIEAALAEKGDA